MAGAILRVRGLPYSATADDVIEFFKDVSIKGGKRGISFPQGPNGRSNGEAFVELEDEDEIDTAMGHHNEHMGRRYIEVFRSDESEMKRSMGWQPDRDTKEHVARLRGLPYDTEKRDIYAFFSELQIAPNGIGLLVDHLGRCTGDAYVQFVSAEMLARAKEKHLEKIGRRYIEIFDATGMEANMAIRKQIEMNQSRGNSSGGGPMMNHGPNRYGGSYNRPPSPGYRESGGYGGSSYGPQGGPPSFGRGSRPGPYSRSCGSGGNFNQRPSSPQRGGYGPPPVEKFGPQGGYNQGSGFNQGGSINSVGGHGIRMRGLPYSVSREEIVQFLAPLTPVNVHICFNSSGRPSGEADVEFATHDEAKEAMKKDREKIGPRYIELFLESTPMGGGGPPRRQLNSQPPQQNNQSPSGGGYGGQSRSYGPPFFGGGGGGVNDRGNNANGGGNDRFSGNGMHLPPSMSQGRPPRGGYYESPNNNFGNMYGCGGSQDEYGCPEERFNSRRDSYGAPSSMGDGGGGMSCMDPRRTSGIKVDDLYDYREDRDNGNDAYYW